MQFFGLREGVVGECVVELRIRAYADKELRFYSMIPSHRLKGRWLMIVITLVRTDNDLLVSFFLYRTHGWVD